MLVVPKYGGIELPVHDPETPVLPNADLFDEEIREVTRNGAEDTFLRTARIIREPGPQLKSLDELLTMTDRELEIVAGLCGAKVVEHAWGLYPAKNRFQARDFYDELLPGGYILVAEVDLIMGIVPGFLNGRDRNAAGRIVEGTDRYYAEGQGTYQLADMRDSDGMSRVEQFMVGAPVDAIGNRQTWLVDIDPHFAVTD